MAATYPTNKRTSSMRRMAYYLAAAVVTAGVLTVAASPAYAKIPVTCSGAPDAGWYVNDDEGSLAPTWSADGLGFSGPGLVHHAVKSSLELADLKPGTFMQTGLSGVAPLLKYETSTPYSTVNQVTTGVDEFWSSKIAAGDTGGQDHPVSAADLATLAPYTAATTVSTFGIGYANDPGSADTITSIAFAGDTYGFTPCPTPPPVPPAGGGSTPTRTPVATPTTHGGNAGSVPNPGVAPVAAVPGVSASSVSPTASDSYNPLGVVPATTDPGFSVGPVVPAGDTAVAQSGGSHLAGYLVGAAVVLIGAVLALWVVIARRRNGDEAPMSAPTTQYRPGRSSDLSATTQIQAIDEQRKRAGE